MAYMRDSARPFPLMCMHAAVAAFAAFSFHVITASAAAAVPGHNPRSDKHSPMFSAICFFITPPLAGLHTRLYLITPICGLHRFEYSG